MHRSSITQPTSARLITILLVAAMVVSSCTSDGSDGGSGSSAPDRSNGAGQIDVYSFAGGCYQLTDEATGEVAALADDGWQLAEAAESAAPFTMQATALGSYLLYGPDGQMVAASGVEDIDVVTDPGPAADWALAPEGAGLSLRNLETGSMLGFDADQRLVQSDEGSSWSFASTSGCDEFPDIDPGATGEPFVGDGVDQPAQGYFDSHTHVSAFSFLGGGFHCGEPWSPYGPAVALKDCDDHSGDGVGVFVESLFSDGTFDSTHGNDGWPTFEGWPKHSSLTHEGTYWRWIERSWRGGLRLMVNDLVDNRALCELYPINDGTDCNDMDNVEDQAADMAALQDYIDAQFGGPGKGFFRLVKTSEEARQVINDGKLAVVLGVEVSEILDCGLAEGESTCDKADIDAGLDELVEMGIRSAFPVHKFDNALGGTKYDGGVNGLIVNAGNRFVTGEWWSPQTCEDGAEPDNEVTSPQGTLSEFVDAMVGVFGEQINPILEPPLPTYPAGPHCNPQGLTELGKYMINGMIDRKMLVETDHLSALARTDALDILEERGYPGAITSHGWGDEPSQKRLVELGGMVAPYASASASFVENWSTAKAGARKGDLFGIGFGTDTNGLGPQPSPREGNEGNPVEYPFETFDGGTTLDKQVSGERTYDVNVDGVAHYGLFPDWVADMEILAGPEIVEDLANGAEAYLQLWEAVEASS